MPYQWLIDDWEAYLAWSSAVVALGIWILASVRDNRRQHDSAEMSGRKSTAGPSPSMELQNSTRDDDTDGEAGDDSKQELQLDDDWFPVTEPGQCAFVVTLKKPQHPHDPIAGEVRFSCSCGGRSIYNIASILESAESGREHRCGKCFHLHVGSEMKNIVAASIDGMRESTRQIAELS